MIKSIISDCKQCPLVNSPFVIGETNCEKNLSSVNLLILAEAPAKEEIKQNRVLVGPAGSIFRKVFQESELINFPYFLCNVVLCSNIINGKTQNPPEKAIEYCSKNWQLFIKICNPDYIMALGTTVKNCFNIEEPISKARGKFFDKFNRKVFVTFHPSYIKRKGGESSYLYDVFLNDFILLKNTIIETNNKKEEDGV